MSTLTPERWREVKAVLADALDVSPAERDAYVDRACGDDSALRQEVTSLLAADAATNGLLGDGAGHDAALRATLESALAGRYVIERELGRGGMATVYLAEDPRNARRVAIKVLDPGVGAALGAERFLAEIRVTAALTHPNVLPLFDSGEADGLLYYVTPYLEGESLRAWLGREPQLPLADALRVAREVADALDYAHRHGVVHRDVKPENVLIADGHAVMADFGIARAIDRSARGGEGTLTATGIRLGTPAYMSPEQAAGERELDGRSDVYALGCTLYEMLAGVPPFTGATARSVLRQHLVADPRPVSALRAAVPAPVEAALRRALAKDPADRFASARELGEALARALPDDMAVARPRRRPAGRRRLGAAAIVVILAGVTVATATLVRREPPGAPVVTGSPVTPAVRSLAVLPFVDPSGDSARAYFVDGMTEGITAELARLAGVAVTSRTSAMHFRQTSRPAPEIARELHVDALVEGSVERTRDRVRLAARLVNGRDGRDLWSDVFERDLRDVLVLQGEVARAIADRVRAGLPAAERARLAADPARGRRVTDPLAYELYLKGRYHYARYGQQAFRTAAGYFDGAIARDSAFAEAYAAKAFACTMRTLELERRAPLAECEAAARRALALDDALPEAHAAVAHVRMYAWDWAAADAEFRHALALNPSSVLALQWYAQLLRQTMRADEALAVIRRAEALDPLDLYVRTQVGWVLFNQRRYDEALAQWDEVLALDPDYGLAIYNQGLVHVLRGRPREALAAADRAAHRLGDASLPVTLLRALGHAAAGDRAAALRLARAMEAADVDRSLVAAVHHLLGDDDATLALLEESFRRHDPFLPNSISEPWLDGLRTHPRFRALRARLGLADR